MFVSQLLRWRFKTIKEFKPKVSAGFDEIPFKVLKSSPDIVSVVLSHIFNLSLSVGKFIDDFKQAKVFPVLKTGDPRVMNSNYRPISLLVCQKFLRKLCSRQRDAVVWSVVFTTTMIARLMVQLST